jgi:asparagine synthase (glutamine-hydrolysing)
MLVAIESQLETGGPVPERAALVTQPLAELCLSIPSWLWCQDGYNRVIARKAFASMLPAQVAWRRSKGAPAHFVTALYEANRGIIGPFLTDGLLASQGLIDRDAVLSALALTGPIKGHDHFRLLGLADVEAWARSL